MSLTAKQEAFCQEYLIDLNGTQAAIRAGYSAKTAAEIAVENLGKPQIASRVQELMDARAKRVERTADDVLRDLHEVLQDAMQKSTNPMGVVSMVNHSAALKALELEGKHRKMFTDKVEMTGADGGPLNMSLKVSFVRPNGS